MTYDTRFYIYLPFEKLPEPVWMAAVETARE